MTDNSAETCPQGDECAVHHRVNEEYFSPKSEYARLITYSGEYAVVTEDNVAYNDPQVIMKVIFGQTDNLPDRWGTMIFHVGDGALGDAVKPSEDGLASPLRYNKTHDNWDLVKSEHDTTVSMLASGLIDLTEPHNPLED